MVAMRVTAFGGMIPARDDRLLPDNAAAYCENAWVYPGSIVGIHQPRLVHTSASAAIQKVYRLPNNYFDASYISDSFWMEFANPFTDVVRAPVRNDTFDRYYWVSPTNIAQYNTRARIVASNAPFTLGIPSPGGSYTLNPTGGVSLTNVTRSYVVTYVSAYGEEGPPTAPMTATNRVDATWAVTLPAAPSGDTTNRNLTHRRIYRTVTSSNGTADYYLVVQLPIATTSYNDTLADTVVTAQGNLESTNWTAPPTDLEGWVSMPNGILCGWRRNELWFSEPYRPHAWPAAYSIAVEYDIVGLGVVGQTVVVCTTGYPAAATGIRPDSMTLSTIASFEPCTSRGSIISSPEGVYYSSPNGLVIIAGGTARNLTKDLVTKDRWQELLVVNTLRAARMGSAYYAFGSTRLGVFDDDAFEVTMVEQEDFTGSYTGVLLDPFNERVAFSPLSSVLPTDNVINDIWSGEVLVLRQGNVYEIPLADPQSTIAHEVFQWRSKVFQAPEPTNFSALQIQFETVSNTPTQNPVANHSLNQTLAANQWGLVRVYADGILRTTREIREPGEIHRLNTGFKATFWQIEIEGTIRVFSAHMTTSVKELSRA